MTSQDPYRPAMKLELTVIGNEMHLCIDGETRLDPAPFEISSEKLSALQGQYSALEAAATLSDRKEHESLEGELGRELADILLGGAGVDRHVNPGRILDECLGQLAAEQYVRLLLRFDTPELNNLPWELASWQRPGVEQPIQLGCDRRIAMSRLEHGGAPRPSGVNIGKGFFGKDVVLSLLNIGADGSPRGRRLYARTRDYVRLTAEYIPGLHTASRRDDAVAQYWDDSKQIFGEFPEIDIVHWRGHGDDRSVWSSHAALTAPELFQHTKNAFLYVIIACASGGTTSGAPNFSDALLNAGAAAVLGTHAAVRKDEFEHLPVFYPLLFQGVPLDYSVQYLRRLYARVNRDRAQGPYECWYKLILRSKGAEALDIPPRIPAWIRPHSASESPGPAALCERFARLLAQFEASSAGTGQDSSTPGRNTSSDDDEQARIQEGAEWTAQLDELLKQLPDD